MFTGASSFEQDLCDWDVGYTECTSFYFSYCIGYSSYTDITAACSGGARCGNSGDDGNTCIMPSVAPSIMPSFAPSDSKEPSVTPSMMPSVAPSDSKEPSVAPSTSLTPSILKTAFTTKSELQAEVNAYCDGPNNYDTSNYGYVFCFCCECY